MLLIQPLIEIGTGRSFHGVTGPEREPKLSASSNAEVKISWIFSHTYMARNA
jgi:hypothetical protein